MRLVLALLGFLFVTDSYAQQQIRLSVGEVHDLRLSRPMRQVIVANEGVIRAEPVEGSDTMLRLRAQQKGQTTITAQDASGAVFLSAIVTVGSPERIIQIISRPIEVKQPDGSVRIRVDVHNEHTYRCDDSRCQRFTPRNRPLDRDDPALSPDQPLE